jgi:glucokinase
MFRNAAAIGADIGRTSIRMAVVRMSGEILISAETSLEKEQSRDYIVGVLIESIKDIRMKAAGSGINPICIGVSAKGFIDHKSGVILGPGHDIAGWQNVGLADILYKATGLPAFIGNDANMMTIAEHRYGAARGYDDVIFVALRTGIGGGLIINGKLYRGMNNAGGEIGQMIINYDNGISDLGIKGSYEHLASAAAVVRRYNELFGKKKGSKAKSLSCREIFELSYAGDKNAIEIVNENAEIVGIGIANLISIFAPEIIILGGGMSEAREDYLSLIKKSAFENSLENCRAKVKIEKALLGNKASIMGSAYHALVRLAGKNI